MAGPQQTSQSPGPFFLRGVGVAGVEVFLFLSPKPILGGNAQRSPSRLKQGHKVQKVTKPLGSQSEGLYYRMSHPLNQAQDLEIKPGQVEWLGHRTAEERGS